MRTPPVYNPARENQRPLPDILPPAQNIANELLEQPIDDVVNGDEIQKDHFALFEPLIEMDTENQELDAIDPLALMKFEPLEPIHNEDIDEIANGIIRPENNIENIVEASNDKVPGDEAEHSCHAVDVENHDEATSHGVCNEVVYEPFDEEISISIGEMPIPFFVGLQLKTNDEFSGKMNFVELVRRLAY